MGYKALYREWRPRIFEDVVGQEHITTTLKNEIINKLTEFIYPNAPVFDQFYTNI